MASDEVRSHRKERRRRKRRRITEGAAAPAGVDSFSSLPDEILQHMLSFLPTKIAITTSALSKRWRHLWCYTPNLCFDDGKLEPDSINKTLDHYLAPKMLRFYLYTSQKRNVDHIEKWIDFAKSRNVEKLSLDFWLNDFALPESFYINSSVKEIAINLGSDDLVPKCSVSWTSLKKLSLRKCVLSDESMAKILSGCPVLESLTLSSCNEVRVLDLRESLRVRTLKVVRKGWCTGPTEIVAPHIHCLKLKNSQMPCTLVDVSSLTETKVNICFAKHQILSIVSVQCTVFEIMEKLQNVEKLTLGGNFLQILSVLELRGVPLPMLKVKDLTLKTVIFQYVIPGIERILLNSPDLKKLTIHTNHRNTIPEEALDAYLEEPGLDPDTSWRSKDGTIWNKSRLGLESEHVASFVELVLKNAERLDKMVLHLEESCLKSKESVPTFPCNKNVSIVVSAKPT